MSEEHEIVSAAGRNSSEEASSTALTGLKRLVLRAGLHARATIGEAAQKVADACGARPEVTGFSRYETKEPSQSFADLPAYRGILKHKEIGRVFDIQDPFYRCHDARRGVETWMAGQRYVNFASYDYLGLNQHPAVIDAAKKAIDALGRDRIIGVVLNGTDEVERDGYHVYTDVAASDRA